MDFILELLQKPIKKDIPKILIIRKLQRNFFFFFAIFVPGTLEDHIYIS